MTIVHCAGHVFDKVKDLVDGKVVRVRYVCAGCGLTLKTRYAAAYLTGKRS